MNAANILKTNRAEENDTVTKKTKKMTKMIAIRAAPQSEKMATRYALRGEAVPAH
jgi:hypothetical protein